MPQFDPILQAALLGALSFGHCLGMCGAFPIHLSQNCPLAANLGRQTLWLTGKTASYAFLGALAGYLGHLAILPGGPTAQRVLAWIAGLAMVAVGLAMIGLRLRPRRPASNGGGADPPGGTSFVAALLRPLMGKPGAAGALVLGIVSGFLPCGVVLAALALAASSASVATGMAVGAALGVGTSWSLLVLGLAGGLVGLKARRWGAILAAATLIALGAVTIARAEGLLRPILPAGAHASASRATTTPSSQPACCE